MPIVLRPPEGDALTQGDILKGLSFAVATWDDKLQADLRAKYLLVISRPCKSLRDEFVVVAPVVQSKLDLSQARQHMEGKGERVTLDRMRRFLAGIRDGGQYTDSFYVGDLDEGSNKRFAADLSSFSTLRVPKDGAARLAWIKEHRVWRLDLEFARDLHVRIFNSVARLGFDDYSWFATPDLEIMITEGQKEISQRQLALAEAQGAVQNKEGAGDNVAAQLRAHIATRQNELREAEEELAPYLAEQARRQTV